MDGTWGAAGRVVSVGGSSEPTDGGGSPEPEGGVTVIGWLPDGDVVPWEIWNG